MHAFALGVRTFLPLEAKPFQVFDHRLSELRLAAIAIQIFVAQDQRGTAGAFLRHAEGARVPQVQITRRRRSNPSAILRLAHADSPAATRGTRATERREAF